MITLKEAEAINRAGHGEATAIVVPNAEGKWREICSRGAQLGWHIDADAKAIICSNGGFVTVVPANRIVDRMRGQHFHFVAIDDVIGWEDRQFIASRTIVEPQSDL